MFGSSLAKISCLNDMMLGTFSLKLGAILLILLCLFVPPVFSQPLDGEFRDGIGNLIDPDRLRDFEVPLHPPRHITPRFRYCNQMQVHIARRSS